ncbi:MAG: DUF1772 domain-containing protein [Reyranella sp.]|uniref:DUF1772 domain-containing protein n=1 Tax=Reyranella sp. TaxID=1929291 RepID=UPI003D1531F6
MLQTLQVLSILFCAIGMGLALAHALEFPGKRRLDGATYRKIQTIYYPGFTLGGFFGEPLAIVAIVALLFVMPFGTVAFWLTTIALVSMLMAHGIYWMVTHPVNKVWLKDERLHGTGAAFFATGRAAAEADWTTLRDRWEMSHVARAACGLVGLFALAAAAVRPM